MNNILIFSISIALLFSFGWAFFSTRLFRDFDRLTDHRTRAVKFVFSATFAGACELFQLLIFEILDILDREYARYLGTAINIVAVAPAGFTGVSCCM